MRTANAELGCIGPYQRLIREATGASSKDLCRIEQIMRDDIFHSTLDWQSRDRLVGADREAYESVRANRELDNLERECGLAMLHQMRAESAFDKKNSDANREAWKRAKARFESARKRLFAYLDTTGA